MATTMWMALIGGGAIAGWHHHAIGLTVLTSHPRPAIDPSARRMGAPVSRTGPRTGLSILLAGGLLLAGCGDDEPIAAPPTTAAPAETTGPPPEPVQHLDITGTEYAFDFQPDPGDGLEPGWTSLTFANEGVEAHQVMFARLKDGVDLAELSRVAGDDSSGAAAIAYVDMLGGVSYIGAGQTTTAMVDLSEGTVVAMCYVPDPDGVAHALSGMTALLAVGDGPGPAPTDPAPSGPSAPAEVAGTIELTADGYRIPDQLPRGWYRVVNNDEGTDGFGLHELSILRLAEEATPEELDQLMSDLATNATPAIGLEAVGGLGAISPGFAGYLHLDLPAGDYVAVDFMPDPGEARPHLLDGYYTAFTP